MHLKSFYTFLVLCTGKSNKKKKHRKKRITKKLVGLHKRFCSIKYGLSKCDFEQAIWNETYSISRHFFSIHIQFVNACFFVKNVSFLTEVERLCRCLEFER